MTFNNPLTHRDLKWVLDGVQHNKFTKDDLSHFTRYLAEFALSSLPPEPEKSLKTVITMTFYHARLPQDRFDFFKSKMLDYANYAITDFLDANATLNMNVESEVAK